MKNELAQSEGAMISRLFFKLLPVQVAIVAMGSINSIVDGVIAARFIDATTVGVVGLYYTMVRILEAAGAVLLGGVTVLSGRYLGAGKVDKTQGVCTLGFTMALIIGALLTAASVFAPGAIAGFLGADAQIKESLATYVLGYAVGIIPQMLTQQMAASLQLERQDRRGRIGVVVMILVNVLLDVLFVAVLRMGVWGLALATSLANWAYFFVLGSYYLTDKAQLKPDPRLAAWGELPTVLKTGFPNALLVACLAARSLVVNRILLTYSGADGLSALSAFNTVCGLIISVALGAGSVIRMLSSVFLGEENREGILSLVKIVMTRVMAVLIVLTVVVVLLAPVIAGIFFPDAASNVNYLTRQLVVIYGISIPVTLVCITVSSYYQAAGHRLFVNLVSLVDGFFSVVIPSLLLAPQLGALGVWWAFPFGLVITMVMSLLYPIIRLRRLPRALDEWLLLPEEFGTGKRLVLMLHTVEDVAQTAERVQAFCVEHGVPVKTGAHAGLCLEEIAGNIVQHGFHADKKAHVVEVRVVLQPSAVVLRIKDDCIPFNPQEWYEMAAGGDPLTNVGIRLVYGLAEEVNYQNLLGLNVLTIGLADQPA